MCTINSANNITVQYSCILPSCFKDGSYRCCFIDSNHVNDSPELISHILCFFGWSYHLNKFAVGCIFLMFAEWLVKVFPTLEYNSTPDTSISEAGKYKASSSQLCRFHNIGARPEGKACESVVRLSQSIKLDGQYD